MRTDRVGVTLSVLAGIGRPLLGSAVPATPVTYISMLAVREQELDRADTRI
jgi:hypothetical protein